MMYVLCLCFLQVFSPLGNIKEAIADIKVALDLRPSSQLHIMSGTLLFMQEVRSRLRGGILSWKALAPITLHSLTSVYIFSILSSICFLRCWQGEFVEQSIASLVGDHFLYSCDPNVWFREILWGEIRFWSLSGVKRLKKENPLRREVSCCK